MGIAQDPKGLYIPVLFDASGTIREASVMQIAESICPLELGSPGQTIVGSAKSTAVEQKTVSTDGGKSSAGEGTKAGKQGRPPKMQRVRAKRLADQEFRMRLASNAEGEAGGSKLLQKISSDPTSAKYACSVLRALNREANERIANGEDPAETAARF